MNPTKKKLFKRQISLSEVGEIGQQKLQKANVLVVGCGGLGSSIAVYLAASGIGNLHIIDFDLITVTNLHRQVFYTLKDIGKSKAKVLSKFIKKRAPFTKVTFSDFAITKDTVFEAISKAHIVVDATDSLPTKYLLNDACVLKNKPLVYGSLYKFDGYVGTFNIKQKDGNFSANLRDLFPKMTTDIPNCEIAGTLNSIVGIIAMQQVNEVLKLIIGIGKPLVNSILIYNSLQNTQLKIKIEKKVSKNEIAKIFEIQNYLDSSYNLQKETWLISPLELKNELESKNNIEIIAVLKNLKLPFTVAKTIPISMFNAADFIINPSKKYVMVCQKGINSYKATRLLKEKYPTVDVVSLAGGISNYYYTFKK